MKVEQAHKKQQQLRKQTGREFEMAGRKMSREGLLPFQSTERFRQLGRGEPTIFTALCYAIKQLK
jgi:hypothetical protein